MTPAPTAAPPKQPSAEAQAKAQAESDMKELFASATEGDSAGARQVQRAIDLERQLGELREKIDSNRTYLRLMKQNEELSEDQVEFVEVFYPEKEKGERRTDAEVEATRRARDVARQ